MAWEERLWDYVDETWVTTPAHRGNSKALGARQVVRVTPPQPGVPLRGIDGGRRYRCVGVEFNFAHTRAPKADSLPDDWPINHHVHWGDHRGAVLADGSKWYRIFHHWANMEPLPGAYDFEAMDAMVRNVRAAGGKVLWVMMIPPDWSLPESERKSNGKGRLANMVNDRNREAFRRFLAGFWERYGAKGSVVPNGVSAIEAWNETNVELDFRLV